MRNLVQDGHTVPLTAPVDRAPGDIVCVGSIVGIAVGAAASGQVVQTRLQGVFKDLPLKSGDVFAAGTLAYYVVADDELTTTAGTNKKFGVSLGGGQFRLNGSF
ncbi:MULTISPECIES: DUF2190 family protein [unclassified Mesorhizobium]|uniref:DUF2190 family protein n=1 Tax=unclassified Mesorhizobium TaxID=325217 RepID=UPI003339D3E8